MQLELFAEIDWMQISIHSDHRFDWQKSIWEKLMLLKRGDILLGKNWMGYYRVDGTPLLVHPKLLLTFYNNGREWSKTVTQDEAKIFSPGILYILRAFDKKIRKALRAKLDNLRIQRSEAQAVLKTLEEEFHLGQGDFLAVEII